MKVIRRDTNIFDSLRELKGDRRIEKVVISDAEYDEMCCILGHRIILPHYFNEYGVFVTLEAEKE